MEGLILSSSYLLVICLHIALIPSAKLSSDELHLTNFPPGHLEALGSRNVQHSLEVIIGFPTPEKFFENYVASSKPVLIRGGAKHSPAFVDWTDEYFLSFAESRDFKIVAEQRKKEIRTHPALDMSFEEFVKTYDNSDIYMVNGVPPFLQ